MKNMILIFCLLSMHAVSFAQVTGQASATARIMETLDLSIEKSPHLNTFSFKTKVESGYQLHIMRSDTCIIDDTALVDFDKLIHRAIPLSASELFEEYKLYLKGIIFENKHIIASE